MSEYCTSCGVAWENHFGLAYTCRSLSEAAEERDEYKARLNTATETSWAICSVPVNSSHTPNHPHSGSQSNRFVCFPYSSCSRCCNSCA